MNATTTSTAVTASQQLATELLLVVLSLAGPTSQLPTTSALLATLLRDEDCVRHKIWARRIIFHSLNQAGVAEYQRNAQMLRAQDEAVVQVSQGSLIVRSRLATFLKLWLPVSPPTSTSRPTSISNDGGGDPQFAVQLAPLDPAPDNLFSASLVDWLFSSSARAFIDLPTRLNFALSAGPSRFGPLLLGQSLDDRDAPATSDDGNADDGDFDATAVSRPVLAPPLEHTNWQTFPDLLHLLMYFIRSGNLDRLAQSLSHIFLIAPSIASPSCALPISSWAHLLLDNRPVVRQFVFNYTSTANDYTITFADFLLWTACLEWSLPLFLVIEETFGTQAAVSFTRHLSNSSVMLNTMVDTLGDCTDVDRVMALLRHLTGDLELKVNVAKVPFLSLHARTYPIFSALFRDHDVANLNKLIGRRSRFALGPTLWSWAMQGEVDLVVFACEQGLVRLQDYGRMVAAVLVHERAEIATEVLALVKTNGERVQVLAAAVAFEHKSHPPSSYYPTLLSMHGQAGLRPKQRLVDMINHLACVSTTAPIREHAYPVLQLILCLTSSSPSLPETLDLNVELSAQQLVLATLICIHTLDPHSALPFDPVPPAVHELVDLLVATLASHYVRDFNTLIAPPFARLFTFTNPTTPTPFGDDVDAHRLAHLDDEPPVPYHHTPAAAAFNATHPTDARAVRLQGMLQTLVRISPGFAAKCVKWHAPATVPLWVWPCFAGVELGKAVQRKALVDAVGELVKCGRRNEVQVLVEAVGGCEGAMGKVIVVAMGKLGIKE